MSDPDSVGELDFDKYRQVNLVTVGHFKKDLTTDDIDHVYTLVGQYAADEKDRQELCSMLGLEELRDRAMADEETAARSHTKGRGVRDSDGGRKADA